MKTLKISLGGVLLFFALLPLTCTEKALSGPQFVFKPAPDRKTVAKFGDHTVTMEELKHGIESDLFELEMKMHKIKMDKLKALVLKKLIIADPKSKGISNDEYLNKYIAKGVSVSQKEVDDFIKKRNISKKHANEVMRKRIKAYLEGEKKKKAVSSWLGKKTSRSPVEVYLPRPVRPVFFVHTENSPSMGKASARATLVEFSDFQCPYCAKGAEMVGKLKKKYGDQLRVVFKHFPLPFHREAQKTAEASLCMHEQGPQKFWDFHDVAFKNQKKLSSRDLVTYAGQLGANVDAFKKCLDSGRFKAKVEADKEEGKKLGIKSTPTFFINGKIVSGVQKIETFFEIIDGELGK